MNQRSSLISIKYYVSSKIFSLYILSMCSLTLIVTATCSQSILRVYFSGNYKKADVGPHGPKISGEKNGNFANEAFELLSMLESNPKLTRRPIPLPLSPHVDVKLGRKLGNKQDVIFDFYDFSGLFVCMKEIEVWTGL